MKNFIMFNLFVFATVINLLGIGFGSAIDFGNVGDRKYVDCGNDYSLQMTDAFTVEAWVKLNDLSSENWQRIVTKGDWVSGSTNYGWLLHFGEDNGNHTRVIIDMEIDDGTSTFTHSIGTGFIISENIWYHCAATYDGNYIKIYINGIEKASLYAPGTMAENHSLNPDGYNLRIGNSYDISYLYGEIDEVRIWNYTLDKSLLQEYMNKIVTSSHPQWSHLKGYWMFDDLSDPSDDYSVQNNLAHLTSYYSGIKPDFITSSAPVGLNSAVVNTNTEVSVGPVGGQIKVTITSTTDDDDYLMVYQYGELDGQPVTNGETFPLAFDRRSNIVWGIQEVGSIIANLTFDYKKVHGVSDPSKIEILRRSNAERISWEELTETSRDDLLETITFEDFGDFGQFSTGGGKDNENPLPVILYKFSATFENGLSFLYWTTTSENNNMGWNIYRGISENMGQAEKINSTLIDGAGTTTEIKQYDFVDSELTNFEYNRYYYWLERISFAGISFLYDPVELKIDTDNNILPPSFSGEYLYNYPNPFNPSTEIKFRLDKDSSAKLEIYNIKGQKIETLFNGFAKTNQEILRVWNANTITSGVYFYKLTAGGKTITKKMILMK